MINKIFSVKGYKISSLLADESALKFSSVYSSTVDGFREAFTKQLSIATKFEIKYEAIKFIRKEDNDNHVVISYKTSLGIQNIRTFTFNNPADCETFFTFFQKEQYFTASYEKLTPFMAIRNYLLILLVVIAATIFCYYQAVKIENGAIEERVTGKARILNYLIGLLGDKGVIIAGIMGSAYLLYKIWSRFSHPPNETMLLPPNA